MKLLLDTRALLWSVNEDQRLGPKARGLITDPANDVLVSVVSLWEIAVKLRTGKLKADIKNISDVIDRSDVARLGISLAHLLALAVLPIHHRNPFDHMLIAQAITEGATLKSEDQNISKYPVQAVSCSG